MSGRIIAHGLSEVILDFQLVHKLVHSSKVETIARDSEIMRADCDNRRLGVGMLRESFSQRRVDQLLQWFVKFTCPTLEDPSKIVVDGESCSHSNIMMLTFLMSRHQKYRRILCFDGTERFESSCHEHVHEFGGEKVLVVDDVVEDGDVGEGG